MFCFLFFCTTSLFALRGRAWEKCVVLEAKPLFGFLGLIYENISRSVLCLSTRNKKVLPSRGGSKRVLASCNGRSEVTLSLSLSLVNRYLFNTSCQGKCLFKNAPIAKWPSWSMLLLSWFEHWSRWCLHSAVCAHFGQVTLSGHPSHSEVDG